MLCRRGQEARLPRPRPAAGRTRRRGGGPGDRSEWPCLNNCGEAAAMTGAAGDPRRPDGQDDDAADVADLGLAIRNLLDPYAPAADPYAGVARRIRARRRRQFGLTGLVITAAVVAGVIAVVSSGVVEPSGRTSIGPAGVASAEPATGPQFAKFGAGSPLGQAYVVASGTVSHRGYRIASVNFGSSDSTCLYADDAVFAQLSQCFVVRSVQ